MPRIVLHKIIGKTSIADTIELPPITLRSAETQMQLIKTKAEEIGIAIIITIRIIRDKIILGTFKIIETLILEEMVEVGIILSRIEQVITILMAITILMVITILMDITIIGIAIIKTKAEAATITITGREIIGEIIIMV